MVIHSVAGRGDAAGEMPIFVQTVEYLSAFIERKEISDTFSAVCPCGGRGIIQDKLIFTVTIYA